MVVHSDGALHVLYIDPDAGATVIQTITGNKGTYDCIGVFAIIVFILSSVYSVVVVRVMVAMTFSLLSCIPGGADLISFVFLFISTYV